MSMTGLDSERTDLLPLIRRKLLYIFAILVGGFLAYHHFLAPAPLSNAERALRVMQLYGECRRAFPEVPEITPEEARRRAAGDKIILVDVRTDAERRFSRLPGAVSLMEFLTRREQYGGRLVVLYDTLGCRAGREAQKLAGQGITGQVLAGGLLGWLHAGGQVVDDGGETKMVHVYDTNWNFPPDGYETAW